MNNIETVQKNLGFMTLNKLEKMFSNTYGI